MKDMIFTRLLIFSKLCKCKFQIIVLPAPILQSLALVQTLVSLTGAAPLNCHWDISKCCKVRRNANSLVTSAGGNALNTKLGGKH